LLPPRTAYRLAWAQQMPAPRSAADVLGTPSGTIMPKDYLVMVARSAYLWGWPLVNQLNRRATFAKAPEPGRLGGVLPVAPTGYVGTLTDYIAADERFVTCPNQDTVYGAGFMALDKQPVVIQVPDFGDRFYTYQLVDHRTDSFYSIGTQYRTKPGFYLLVGSNWNGTPPDGITGVGKSSTDLVAIFPRIFQDDTPEDKAAIQSLLRQVMVYPLTEFDGQMKTKDWSAVPSFPAPASAGKGETKWVVPEKFFDQLPKVLQTVPPLPGEDPQIKDALTQIAVAAENELIKPLFDFHNNGQPIGNGWTSPPNNARWGTDYLSRTATARSNMFDNAPNETKYIYTDFDKDGPRLTGVHRFSVTFAPSQTPPVNGFWSLTVYNKEHLFEPNNLNRFSLGTKSKSMKTDSDGSLTLGASRVAYPLLVYMPPPLPRHSVWAILRSSTQPYQPSPKGLSGRPTHCPFRGLPSVHSRCGLHTRAVTNS
jgi:hypothetical protein